MRSYRKQLFDMWDLIYVYNNKQLKDAGGFEALVTGKTTSIQRIDVNERITSLERLNPSPRPTTYVYALREMVFFWLVPIAFSFLQVSLFPREMELRVVWLWKPWFTRCSSYIRVSYHLPKAAHTHQQCFFFESVCVVVSGGFLQRWLTSQEWRYWLRILTLRPLQTSNSSTRLVPIYSNSFSYISFNKKKTICR